MRKIPVEDIKDDMVLAEEVLDDRGEVLLSAGDKLRKTYSAKLGAWGVTEIFVEGEESAPAPRVPKPPEEQRLPKEVEERIRTRVNHRFANVIEDPSMRRLMELSIKRLLARTANGHGST